jgi:hypothetical protein
MNMMRKNNNRGGNKHRGGNGGGQRRYNNGGGNNRSGQNDGQNLQRQKHHATQQLGKYSDMARNAQSNGDRIEAEYYLQHVDHYTRVLADVAAIEAERYAHQRESQIIPGGPNDPNAVQPDNAESPGEANNAVGSEQPPADVDAGNAQPQQQQPRQPRLQRQPRPDNGAREANSNTTEIPLPGNILPPI